MTEFVEEIQMHPTLTQMLVDARMRDLARVSTPACEGRGPWRRHRHPRRRRLERH